MFLRRFAISEQSMSPSFREGDFLVTFRRNPTCGDVIVFEHPSRPGFYLLKRVVAMGGQTIEIRGGDVLINEQPANETWTADSTEPDGLWKIPPDHVFVLGDARYRSTDDSRTLGPIRVEGKADVAGFRYWPGRRIGRIRR